MDNLPLTPEEKQIIIDDGWVFASDEYIFIPDDYDGQMASGIRMIRRVLNGIKARQSNCPSKSCGT